MNTFLCELCCGKWPSKVVQAGPLKEYVEWAGRKVGIEKPLECRETDRAQDNLFFIESFGHTWFSDKVGVSLPPFSPERLDHEQEGIKYLILKEVCALKLHSSLLSDIALVIVGVAIAILLSFISSPLVACVSGVCGGVMAAGAVTTKLAKEIQHLVLQHASSEVLQGGIQALNRKVQIHREGEEELRRRNPIHFRDNPGALERATQKEIAVLQGELRRRAAEAAEFD